MQELLGRIHSLDPHASESIRIIACFDELMAGGVSIHGLVAAAAALSGSTAGAEYSGRFMRVARSGEAVVADPTAHVRRAHDDDGVRVWIEGDEDAVRLNDDLLLERLSLAVRMRRDHADRTPPRRDLALLIDPTVPEPDRLEAASRLRLSSEETFRVVLAPLFASWKTHPRGPEDVVPTASGPLHVALIRGSDRPEGTPAGIGVATPLRDLPTSFRTAMVAVRLHDGRSVEASHADDLGGLAVTLADLAQQSGHEDRDRITSVTAYSWGASTLDAIIRTTTMREAARVLGIHPSTMAARVDSLTAALGFDPMTGLGRTRMGIGFLLWRVQSSTVLDAVTVPAD